MEKCPLAHSASTPDGEGHLYRDHISAVTNDGTAKAEALAVHIADLAFAIRFVKIVASSSHYHDLGKLDPDNQRALAKGREGRMPWDHIDAGVAYLSKMGAWTSAWAVRAHHAPGLPKRGLHFAKLSKDPSHRKLRGRRQDSADLPKHREQITRTDSTLDEVLALHRRELGAFEVEPHAEHHGLALRLALSCLVDADHEDTARYTSGYQPAAAPSARWSERLAQLDAKVAEMQSKPGSRNPERQRFYNACRTIEPLASMATCQGPVGIGKTTAVLAYLLRRAIATNSRRLFVIAPYTAILKQTSRRLRDCLVLPDEVAIGDHVIAEHHHRADFESIDSRELATLWRAPIILTTAVQFFETLAGCAPSNLRKLHALPGSVVFIDESHAVMPSALWPQNWRWMRELSDVWGCSWVYASGSLAEFWRLESVTGMRGVELPDLVPSALTRDLVSVEGSRVRYRTLGRLEGISAISKELLSQDGPRLVIFNTVFSAASFAKELRDSGGDVIHLSTALCPRDREHILERIEKRLHDTADKDWTLVATSLVEAGLDLSFRVAFRERFSAASLIQVGGRVNRHGEQGEPAVVLDFFFDSSEGLKRNPGARRSAAVLGQLFEEARFDGAFDPAQLVSEALSRELEREGGEMGRSLLEAERTHDYPEVARLGRLIDADTRLVIVDPEVRRRIEAEIPVSMREMLNGSVQLWSHKISELGLMPIENRHDIYWWPHAYDPEFLGYMQGALEMSSGAAYVV